MTNTIQTARERRLACWRKAGTEFLNEHAWDALAAVVLPPRRASAAIERVVRHREERTPRSMRGAWKF